LDSGIESYWTFVLCFASVLDSKSWWWWVFVGDGVDGGVGLRTWGVNVELHWKVAAIEVVVALVETAREQLFDCAEITWY
jgi:hypothetical protein